jgi:hypothetical protein
VDRLSGRFFYSVSAQFLLYSIFFTIGYADQFGGRKGTKFKYKTLQQLLVNSRALTMSDQENVLHEQFRALKGELEQLDDVCIVGIKL